MSVKIYEGLKLKDPKADVFQVMNFLADRIEKASVKLVVELVSREIANLYDQEKFRASAKAKRSLFSEVEESWRQEQKAYGSSSRFNDPLRFEIAFGKAVTGDVLAIPFYEEKAYGKVLKSCGLFQPYGYWNNTEMPRGVSQKAWEERRAAWESVTVKHNDFTRTLQWSLPRTENPFVHFWLNGKLRSRLDYNSDARRAARKRSAYIRALMAASSDVAADNIFTVVGLADKATAELMNSPAWLELPSPEPIPDPFRTSIDELPSPFEPDPETLKRLIVRMNELKEKRPS